jgi:hypothetical protein
MDDILTIIGEGNDDLFQNHYNKILQLKADTLDKDEFDEIIFKIIDICYDMNSISTAVDIIYYFDEIRINIDPLPTITGLFLNPHFNSSLLKWTTSLIEKDATGYYLDIINYRDDENAVIIAEQLLELFPDVTENDWIELAKLTENDDEEGEVYVNESLRRFFLSQTNNFAAIPEWIIDVSNEDIFNDNMDYPNNIPSVEEAVGMILDDLERIKINITTEDDDADTNTVKNNIKENLIAQYAISTSQDKIYLLSNIININNFDDSHIFRKYGPVNTDYSKYTIDTKHICSKYGGCRMLLCNEYSDVDIYGEKTDLTSKYIKHNTPDWFIGKCQRCDKKIRHRNHSLRLPLIYGGWKGCFCSFSCITKDIENPITAVTIGRIKTQLSKIGINNY